MASEEKHTGPKRVAVEGIVTKDTAKAGDYAALIDSWSVGAELVETLLADFEGQRVRLTVEAIAPDEVDIDGVVDERQHIRYIGKAMRQPDGTYIALAAVNGSLCRVELTITPTAIGKDPEWEKGLGDG